MANPLLRLQTKHLPKTELVKDKKWIPTKLSDEALKALVVDHIFLKYEYNVYCSSLIEKYQKLPTLAPTEEEIICALGLSEILESVYRCINVKAEFGALAIQQKQFRDFLRKANYTNLPNDMPTKSASSLSAEISNKTVFINFFRLFIQRLRRLFLGIAPLNSQTSKYNKQVTKMGNATTPILMHLGWTFFLPRLLKNLFFSLKHLIDNKWMTEEERRLDLWTRFKAQFARRWFQLANDIVWVVGGFLLCFVFTAGLPAALWLALALQIFDIFLVSVRAAHEVHYYKDLQKQYAGLDSSSLMAEHLKKCIAAEEHILYWGVANQCLLLLAFAMFQPIFIFNPIAALVGIALSLALTVIHYKVNQHLENQRPTKNLKELPTLFNRTLAPPSSSSGKEEQSALESTPTIVGVKSS